MKLALVILAVNLLVLPLLIAWGDPSRVTGRFTNVSGSKTVYLYEAYGDGFFLTDSTEMLEGRFVFDFDDLDRGFYRIGISQEVSVVAVLGEPEVQISADLKNPEHPEFVGSKENPLLAEYQDVNRRIKDRKYQTEQKVKSGYTGGESQDYRLLVQGLKQSFDSLDTERNEFYRQLADRHPDLFMGKICKFLNYDDPASYFDYEEFQDKELWRGDMIPAKTLIYFQTLLPRNINHWISNTNKILAELEAKSPQKELVYGAITNLFAISAPDYAARIAKRYFEEYPNSRYSVIISSSLPPGPPQIGEAAPDIELDKLDGQPVKLSSLKGQVVLVDFWASWCKPCRIESPNLVRAHSKYKERGFTIFSVSLDHDRDKWLKTVKKDKLTWLHVSDLRGWQSEGAKVYQVKAIPASYLLDSNGIIIAHNLRGDKLRSTLDRILK